ncbi:glycoside hydrolase family 3 protein [Sphaerobolus stellatus SS14]|uniref:beta-glucosidase n=1 Tax=Sphaerobolus stellatus (strain SS14) TaxID=990650 RepID=A0A0C9U915_SPHS4|nr:glycoside hydrolase family 3 protein [Sphaerobolus stellatus SS14]
MVNQTQSCQNSKMINGLLKEELDFQGFMLSDWAFLINGVQVRLIVIHRFFASRLPAARARLHRHEHARLHGIQPTTESNPDNTQFSWRGSALIESVKNGPVPQARVDDMVTRTIAAFFKLCQDKNYPGINFDYNTQNTFVYGQPLNQHLIRTIGAANVVLLKNMNRALPLNTQKIKCLAFLGPNPEGPNNCQNGNTDHRCSQGTRAMGWGSGTGYITVNGNSGDHTNITLWHGGETLIQRTASSCANTIVVMHIVGPVTVETWIDHPNVTAVIKAGLPGQESGNGLVDAHFVAVNCRTSEAKKRAWMPGNFWYKGRCLSCFLANQKDLPAPSLRSLFAMHFFSGLNAVVVVALALATAVVASPAPQATKTIDGFGGPSGRNSN